MPSHHSSNAQALLNTAIQAVIPTLPAARMLGATLAGVPPIDKADSSPVTAADYVLQAVIVARLRSMLPGGRVPLFGEEHADALIAARRPDVERLVVDGIRSIEGWMPRATALAMIDGDAPRSGEPYWTIDPIDGTRGFLLGAQCSVCLALIEGSVTTVGVLGCPRMGARGDLAVHLDGPGVIYGAALGSGAFEFSADGKKVGPVVSLLAEGKPLRWARSLNRSKTPVPSRLEPCISSLGEYHCEHMDSQCKYALLARGDADFVVRLPRFAGHSECIWDHASGTLIAQESGAIVSDALGDALDFSHGALLAANTGILCAAPGLGDRLLQAIAPLAGGVPR